MAKVLQRDRSAWVPNWEVIRDQKVRAAELQAAIELRALEEARQLLESRQRDVKAELTRLGQTEAGLRVHGTLGRWWGRLFCLYVLVLVMSAWWSVNWYLSLTWEKGLLALTLFVLPLIGWMIFLTYAGERVEGKGLWKLFAGLGLVVIIFSVVAAVLLGTGRMAGTTLEEEYRQAASSTSEDLTASPGANPSDGRAARVKRLLTIATVVAVSLLTVAGEIAAGVAFHFYLKRMTLVWTVEPYYREQADLREDLAENASRQEEARLRPELLHVQLTEEGLRQAAAVAEAEAEARRLKDEDETRRDSLSTLVKRVLIFTTIGLLCLLGLAAFASGEERSRDITVVVLDLSTSAAEEEFAANVRAVEGVIRRTSAGGARVVVIGIGARSFAGPLLFDETSPRTSGRFGEYQTAWHERVLAKWRKTAATLKPDAKESDVFGALARAAVELGAERVEKRSLVILSDMRHVGRGVNLERPISDVMKVIEAVDRQGLVPQLEGVKVWVLGAHTRAIDERQWGRLRTFWTEYFRRAGANLEAFRATRRMAATE